MALVQARLTMEGHPDNNLYALAQQIVEAASHRLVFLVEVEQEQVGFEIRSLQEFMAAECLMDTSEHHIKERLNEIAPLPFWRNVFLFAAGKCFSERQELRETVRDICAELNEIDYDSIAGTYRAGSDLAIALLEEGSSRHQPRFEHLLARIATRALDTANPHLQIQLADVYEPQLETIYQDEINLRLTSTSAIQLFGAWNCLLKLVAADVDWAVQLATAHWPLQPDKQVSILRSVIEPTLNNWTFDKLLELVPVMPTRTFRNTFQTEFRRRGSESQVLKPELNAALLMLQQLRFRRIDTVELLNTGISYGPVRRLTTSDNVMLPGLPHDEDWHPSWHVYELTSEFLQTPSKDSLAETLNALASFIYDEGNFPIPEWDNLPWPILACLSSCANSQELLEMAERAHGGELGDIHDWKEAETRWFSKGVTYDDLICMSDERLPFDAEIRSNGFLTSISTLSPVFIAGQYRDNLGEVLDMFRQSPPGKTRSFLASMINWILFYYSYTDSHDDTVTLPPIDMQTLESVYQSVPPRSLIPLHMIVCLVGDSMDQLVAIWKTFKAKNCTLDSEGEARNLVEGSIHLLRRAYMIMDEDSLLLSVLAEMAEGGDLVDHHIDIKHPDRLETAEEKAAALIITLSQETWQSGSAEQLIQRAQEIGDSTSGTFDRIANILGNSQSAGENVERFVVALIKLIPSDDLFAHRRYVNLVENVLRQRTSHFAELHEGSQFALPTGIVALLRK